MKKNICSLILFLADVLSLFIILFITIGIKQSFKEGESFCALFLEYAKYDILIFSSIVFLITFIFFYEKIYTLRFDFWQESFKIIKSLFLSFVLSLVFF